MKSYSETPYNNYSIWCNPGDSGKTTVVRGVVADNRGDSV